MHFRENIGISMKGGAEECEAQEKDMALLAFHSDHIVADRTFVIAKTVSRSSPTNSNPANWLFFLEIPSRGQAYSGRPQGPQFLGMLEFQTVGSLEG